MANSHAHAHDKDSFLKSIGSVLHTLRTEKNMTLRNVADATNKSISYLSEIESGKKSPDVSVYKDIADALDMDLYRIFFRVSEEMHLGTQQRKTIDDYSSLFRRMESLSDQLNKNDDEDEDEDCNGGVSNIPNSNVKFSLHV